MAFKESEHPRDADGKFVKGAAFSSDREPEEIAKEIFPHLRDNGKQKISIAGLTTGLKSDIIKLPDIPIGKSVGAKAINYEVKDLDTGEYYHFCEGTYLQDVHVFAGGRSKTPYRKAYVYAFKKGGKIQDWEHVKGVGWLDTKDGPRKAAVHWSQCKNIGKFDFFVKEWMDEG